MSLHYWTSEFAGVEIPYSMNHPSEDAWRAYLEKHADAASKLLDAETLAEYKADPALICDYESADSEIGEVAFVCDIINEENPYTLESAADADGWQYLGLYARYTYPWSNASSWNAGLTKDEIERLANEHLGELYGISFSFNDSITISFSS